VKWIRSLVALSGAMLTISQALPGRAEAAPPEKAELLAEQKPARPEARPNEKKKVAPTKILRLEELKVEGRIQKPQAMFLMPRANLNIGELDRSESMLPKVSQVLTKPPF
jgi:hypothetical protein